MTDFQSVKFEFGIEIYLIKTFLLLLITQISTFIFLKSSNIQYSLNSEVYPKSILRRPLSMKGNHTRYTATAIGKAEYLKVIGCDLYDMVSGRPINTVPCICSVKIHLIALICDKIRSVVCPECVR